MDKDTIKKLALDLKFELNEEEVKDIQKDFELLEEMLNFFDEIDTDNVKEMIYPYDIETTYLRKDEVSKVLSNEEVMKNAPESRQGHIVVPRVVK